MNKLKKTIGWLLTFMLALQFAVIQSAQPEAAVRAEPVAGAWADFSGYNPDGNPSHPNLPSSARTNLYQFGITGSGLGLREVGDAAPTTIQLHDGQWAVVEDDFAYFFIYDEEILAAETVTMSVTFFDNRDGSFGIQYCSKTEAFLHGPSITMGNSQEWVTVNIQLDECDFINRSQHDGSKFRFQSGRSGIIIKSVAITVGGMPDPSDNPPPPFAGQTEMNNLIGKGVTGYQVWFRATDSEHGWSHWGMGHSTDSRAIRNPPPSSGYNKWTPSANLDVFGEDRGLRGGINVDYWPYVADYLPGTRLFNSAMANLPATPDGLPERPAQLFNSADPEVIRTHFMWMRDAGVDGAAIQRFFETTSAVDTGMMRNHLMTIAEAAEEFDRLFYVMYDMSAAGRDQYSAEHVVQRVKLDWIYNVENKGVASSPGYAHAEGRPVVCIWGMSSATGRGHGNQYAGFLEVIELTRWFRDRGYYVIGGTPEDEFFATGVRNFDGRSHDYGNDEQAANRMALYQEFDMISPWYVGRESGRILGNINGPPERNFFLQQGIDLCNSIKRPWADNKPIAFMPTIQPGGGWVNMGNPGGPNAAPRMAGQLIWEQLMPYLNDDKDGIIQSLYFSMLDEYDESTNWLPAARDYFDMPTDQYFTSYSVDGTWVSADFYLRIMSAAVTELRKKLADATYNVPKLNDWDDPGSIIVEHSQGPLFYRNSFERRDSRRNTELNGMMTFSELNHMPLDPGVMRPDGSNNVYNEVMRNLTTDDAANTVFANRMAHNNVDVTKAFNINRHNPSHHRVDDDVLEYDDSNNGLVYTDDAKSGGSAFRLSGERTAGDDAFYAYRISETRINVGSNMMLEFWLKHEGVSELDGNVFVDLHILRPDGSAVFLSDVDGADRMQTQAGGWDRSTVRLPASLEGSVVTEVVAVYKDSGGVTGAFSALIDDISIYGDARIPGPGENGSGTNGSGTNGDGENGSENGEGNGENRTDEPRDMTMLIIIGSVAFAAFAGAGLILFLKKKGGS
jgi:hypothetical protein